MGLMRLLRRSMQQRPEHASLDATLLESDRMGGLRTIPRVARTGGCADIAETVHGGLGDGLHGLVPEQIELLDRLKLVVKAMKGLPPDTNFAQALAAAITEGARALKALEKEQEPMIAAGIAASKASAEAYAIAFKAWEARMERERTPRSEEARREKL